MQKITDKEFDQFFKHQLSAAESAPPAAMFEKIERGLKKKKKKRGTLYAVAACITTLLLIGFLWNQSFMEKNTRKAVAKEQLSPQKELTLPAPILSTLTAKNIVQAKESANTETAPDKVPLGLDEVNDKLAYGVAAKKAQLPAQAKAKQREDALLLIIKVAESAYEQKPQKLLAQLHRVQPAVTVANVGWTQKNDGGAAMAANTQTVSAQKNALFTDLLQNFKEKITNITHEVVRSNAQQTTINLGFVAITKYKN